MSVCFAIVKIEMGVFVWNGGGMGKKRTGCPSTPIHGQPTLHDDCPYIDIMQNVKNFVQKLNYIHSLLKCSGNSALRGEFIHNNLVIWSKKEKR